MNTAIPFAPGYVLPGNSLSELKRNNPTLFESFLQYVPDSAIERAEQSTNPWLSLLSVPKLSEHLRSFFKAGASQASAVDRLIQIEGGVATINHSSWDEMAKTGASDKPASKEKVQGRVIMQLLLHGSLTGKAKPRYKNEEQRVKFKLVYDKAQGALRKRYGKNWQKDKNAEPPYRQHKEALFLVFHWLDFFGEAGLCFYSDEAIAKLVVKTLHGGYHVTQMDSVTKLRKKLSLEKLNNRMPTIRAAKRSYGPRVWFEQRTKEGCWKKYQPSDAALDNVRRSVEELFPK